MPKGCRGTATPSPCINIIPPRRKDARNEMRVDVLDYVGFFFDFQNSFIPNYLAQRNPCIPFRLFQGYTPADCFMLRARSLTLDSALPKIWLRFTIFAKLFHFVQFSLLWSFLRKLLRRPLTATNKSKTEPFWLCFTHGLRLLPHNQAKRIFL